ncbi:HAD-IA family hydrolase [Bacillus mangrovi]|uniref:HAD-IA family hydrolase n=1 Tax=Metabacillus mangrovi TaxID=1491830 RepID=A0A7X2S5F2_9BACI|nr:HAD family hydrolase [Metabacillus mangrovi]MTH53546.1 HAD-IA family hydrolase [Metabacillus mangrovi]
MKAMIFDFDGTLANTLPNAFQAFQEVFKSYDQKEITSDDIKAMFGPPEQEIILRNLAHENKEEAVERFYKLYEDRHQELVKPDEEISGMLQSLKERGTKIGIVTGKSRRGLDISLKALEMDIEFDAVVTGDDVNEAKPAPEGIQRALAEMDAQPEHAMYIGDSDADIEAGLAAGVYTVGVQWLPEFQTAEFKKGPHAVYTTVRDFRREHG